jgi:uncharacterized protein YmfQ (DUF2313 family)
MRTTENYREHLKALLPPGQAFSRDAGTNLDALLDGMAKEMALLDARGEQLISDANPQATLELLPDWERIAGLPDNCSGSLETTLQGRRNALISKLSASGGQSPAYFIEIAAALGYQITIEEFRPFRAGRSSAGGSLTNGDWVHTWRVRAPATTTIPFRAGLSGAGEPLAAFGVDSLECKINQLKPAHTQALFAYGA